MTIAETLQKALDKLWDGSGNSIYKHEFICITIEDTTKHKEEVRAAIDFLKTYGMSTAGSWFTRNTPESSINSPPLMQLRRKTFLQVAIKHALKLRI